MNRHSVPPATTDHVSPMMAQYMEIKAVNTDCLLFYRMGDFYELFFEDAEIASRILGIVLTKRGRHLGQDIPMCGVPVVRADEYLQRLIAAGRRVAVCEQTEDPAVARARGGKSVVKRDVVRLITPGTITEDALLDPSRANLLVALARRKPSELETIFGWAAVDISTGRFLVGETAGDGLAAELARLEPREIVIPDALRDDPALAPLWREIPAAITPIGRDGGDAASAERRLKESFGVAALDGFGDFGKAEIAAAALALAYIERTQFDSRPSLQPPRRERAGGAMRIDAATRANLELTRTLGGERAGSLLACIDRTLTPGGGRLLAEWLAAPLTDVAAIRARQDGVTWFIDARGRREEIRAILQQVPDMARALSRLALDRAGPRDLLALGQGLAEARRLGEILRAGAPVAAELVLAAQALSAVPQELPHRLVSTLADDVPLLKRDGGFVREGYDADLDELRELQVDSRRFIAALQGRYAMETGCRTLRIKHNNVLGYFVEVPAAVGQELAGERGRGTFVHRQTMADAMRFTTVELGELEGKIVSAADRALKRELALFEELRQALLGSEGTIREAADAIAVVDVAAAMADLAADRGWSRPVVEESLAFAIEGGRHPAVEAALLRDGKTFVANDAELAAAESGGPEGLQPRIVLLTGPNMAGKSTYLRQNALIAILAQMGAYVPARAARIGLIDQLFSRVGAADDLARGRSTFMVEMVETAAILNQATERSLVILDEIGRGTATFDGLSIAWATVEHLHATNRCRAIFATHFHELTALAEVLPRVTNATVKVREWDGDVVFLHEVVPGAADRSYGIQVAKLAGLPAQVVTRARAILGRLEKTDRESPVATIMDELPLFAAMPKTVPPPAPTQPAEDQLREALATIDPDDLSPREALEALYRLKKLG